MCPQMPRPAQQRVDPGRLRPARQLTALMNRGEQNDSRKALRMRRRVLRSGAECRQRSLAGTVGTKRAMLAAMSRNLRQAVLAVAHGTISDLNDLPEFLRRIRRGRPAHAELIAELRRRYQAIGGSPMLQHTRAQVNALSELLEVEVLLAMRFWEPSIAQVLREVVSRGIRRVCVLPLAPFSVATYCDAVADELADIRDDLDCPPELVPVEDWSAEPEFVTALASHIARGRARVESDAALILTAHSRPLAIGPAAVRYQQRVTACATAVGSRLGQPALLCFQSQGSGSRDWIGPPLRVGLQRVREQGHKAVVVAPIGFLAEQLETVYDLDTEAAQWAAGLGLRYHRLPVLGDHPLLMQLLVAVAGRALAA